MQKGDKRWTILFLILAFMGVFFIQEKEWYKYLEAIIILIALVNTIIGYKSKN